MFANSCNRATYFVYIYIYIYTHTYIHTYIYIYIHTHTYTDSYIYHLFISILILSFQVRAGLPRNLVPSVFYQTFLRVNPPPPPVSPTHMIQPPYSYTKSESRESSDYVLQCRRFHPAIRNLKFL